MIRVILLIYVLTDVANAEPQWQFLQPVRQPHGQTAYDDILSHVLQLDLAYHSKETIAHENTHGINSELRQRFQGKPSFYCLKGRYISLQEPRFSKATVIRYIPTYFRQTAAFQTYLVGGEWSNALYLLDEYSAYMNGAEAGMDLEDQGLPQRDNTECVKDAVIFSAYATAIVISIDQLDPTYPDKQRLREFVGWSVERSLNLAERAKRHPNFLAHDLENYVQQFKKDFIQEAQSNR